MTLPQSSEENSHAQTASLSLMDELGRTLTCCIEHSLTVDGQDYVLLLPDDAPIEIFTWQIDGDEETAVLLERDVEIDAIFATAAAVLQELNLTLKRTALTLTVAGDLPPIIEDEILTLELEDDAFELEPEQFQLLANFFHQDQEHGIYTPLDPLLFFARLDDTGQPQLLSPEEFQNVQPLLESQILGPLQ